MPRSQKEIFIFALGALAIVAVVFILLLATTPFDARKTTQIKDVDSKNTQHTHENQLQHSATIPEVNQTHPLQDQQFQNLTDKTVDSISETAMSRLRYPIHVGRSTLLERMRQETPEETFLHLPDFDGMAMVFPMMGSMSFSPGDYDSDIVIISKSNRIRKLLADTRKKPGDIAIFLERQLIDIASGHQANCEEFSRRYNDANTMVKTHNELPNLQQDAIRSTAAVYILSQIDAFQAFPTLAWLSTIPLPFTTPKAPYTRPVDNKFLFYAMHELVTRFPENLLSKKAARARQQYLVLADTKNVPQATRLTVTSWDAYYNENDFRRTILRKNLSISAEPTIELNRFPELNMQETDVNQLLKALQNFSRLAFPDSKPL